MTRMMRRLVLAMVVGFTACGGSPTAPDREVTFRFDFTNGPQEWLGGFSGYSSAADPSKANVVFNHRPLLSPLDTSQRAWFVSGGGEGAFMFLKRRVTGVRLGTRYGARFEVEIATDTPCCAIGAGDAPGEGVVVKAGAVPIEPLAVLSSDGSWIEMNIDKGSRKQGGRHALTIGNIANSQMSAPFLEPRWELKQLSSGATEVEVEPAGDGSVWLLMGTDSAFFGTSRLYYTKFAAVFTPR